MLTRRVALQVLETPNKQWAEIWSKNTKEVVYFLESKKNVKGLFKDKGHRKIFEDQILKSKEYFMFYMD